MKLNAIELEGFQSYRKRERVELDGIQLAAIVGDNRVGKSTIVSDALMYALFGSSRGASVNDVISRGEPKATVTVEFTVNGGQYKITRFRTRKNRSEAALYVRDDELPGGWRDLSEKNPAAAEEELRHLIGVNADTARLTWMISQSDFGAFCELKPAPRRQALADAFNLGAYADLNRAAERKRAALARDLDLVSADLARANTRIGELNQPGPFPMLSDDEVAKNAKDAEKRAEQNAQRLANLDDPGLDARVQEATEALAAFEAGTRSAIESYRRSKMRFEQAQRAAMNEVSAASNAVDAATAAGQQLAQVDTELAGINERGQGIDAQLASARRNVGELAGEPARLEAVMASIKSQGEEVNEQISTLKSGIAKGQGACFTCNQHLSEQDARILIDAKETHRAGLLRQYSEANTAKLEAQRRLASAQQDVTRLEQQRSSTLAQLRQVESRQAQLRAQADTLGGAQERHRAALAAQQQAGVDITSLGEEPTVDVERQARLQAQVTAARQAKNESVQGQGKREQYQQDMHAAREESRRMWQEQQRRASVAAELATLRPQQVELDTKVKKLAADVSDHELLVEAFKPSGIPSMILAGVVEELNEDANETLGLLGDDGLGVNISTQREKQRGGVEEKVMINAITADGEADYKTLSGSEKFRVALAIRLGLAQCIARRTGSPVETIVMDEGWGALDAETKVAVQDVLTRLSKKFAVFTVSHVEDVRSAFPTLIEVSKASGTSRCTIRHAA